VDGNALVFVDLDGDGSFDRAGIDGWMPAGTRSGLALPLEETVVLGRSEYRLVPSADGTKVSWERTPLAGPEPRLAALEVLNGLRLANGLPPVGLDPQLSEDCEKHARYLDLNGISEGEDPAKPGYTPEGAATAEVTQSLPFSAVDTVKRMWSNFYHRVQLASPWVGRVGIGVGTKFTTIDAWRSRDERRWTWPVAIPAPSSAGHPTRLGDENPRPFPDGMDPGSPITLTFHYDDYRKVTDARATLRTTGKKPQDVPCLVSAPDAPAVPRFASNYRSIAVIPTRALRPDAVYAVVVRWRFDGEDRVAEWTFTTGKDLWGRP
jgi:hypothetical protein